MVMKNTGLRGVAVADTKVSFIDGEKGILIYRGFRIEDLAEHSTFLEVAFLLLNGTLPTRKESSDFEAQVLKARPLPPYLLESLRHWPREARPMDVLQASVPMLAMAEPELAEESRGANVRMATRLIARIPAAVAAWHRIRQGLDPLPPDDSLSHAANFLWQLHGKKPDDEAAHDLDVCLILHADHTFNASTFACREVASTRAHMYAAVTAGIGALSGSLHGGANAEVMKMLMELENEKDIPGWVASRLQSGSRIMGMGHAVYKTMDPRAKYLKQMAQRLGKKTGQSRWHELSTEIEQTALKAFAEKGKTEIQPNVDFFSAPVYHIMGIPRDLMTPIFAISRVSGWCSHIIEEKFAEAQEKPQLYRPQAEYVGRYCGLMGCEWEPPEARTGA
ncbi:MAG: citrate (Si)-synthase [Deltaproteobacteria bacterium HGW-Deltaproteobacteria-21]|nr:MAG: citrate (Si)-synthase [Deltaproteobacteria bacterium HGW-Deltaproteobacteria-21]